MSASPSPTAPGAAFASLNDEQRVAVTHTGSPLLIVAGAGTGKTATLAHRVAWLIAEGADPGKILLLTFTRRAAAEMLRRAEGVLAKASAEVGASSAGSRVWGGTYHSVGARLLRLHARDLGMQPDFTILDRGDAEDLMHLCRTDLGLGRSGKRFPQKSTCLDIYSRVVNEQRPVDDVVLDSFPWCRSAIGELKELFGAFTDAKERQQVLDYDDLLLFWNALLTDPAAGPRIRERFDHVLVDEFQDTNTVQAEIVSGLAADGASVTCVGDDAQAIYSFRAATVRNILDFESRFPGATVVTLTRNYRSSEPILTATNAIIAEASERREKDLWTAREGGSRPSLVTCVDENEQTDWVVDRILDHREQGTELKEQAVLFRAQHHSMALELELSRRNIPYRKYGGLRFVETAHVKDLTAFLRLAENPLDSMAALRVLGLVPGIGPATARKLAAALAEADGDLETWVTAAVPEAASAVWPGLVSLLRSLSSVRGDVAAQIHAVSTIYRPLMDQRYDNVDARIADLEQIEALAGGIPDRAALLSELAVDPPAWTSDLAGPPVLDEDWLVLSTIHSAKGLEFDVVYVIHAADGNIPSDMATGSPAEIDEERRLFYVACTRARNDLYVTHPLRYYKAGNPMTDTHGYAQRTRFISDDVLPHFVAVEGGRREPGTESPLPATTTADVRGGIRSLWA